MDKFVSIQLDKSHPLPLYQQLYEALKNMISQGTLQGSDKMPPIRKLASMLGVNNVTVVNAYRQLEQDALVYSRVGSGTFVKQPEQPEISTPQQVMDLSDDRDYDIPEIGGIDHGQLQISETAINFASVVPTSELFPVEDFKIILNEVLDRDRGNAFGYQESQGYYPLRESVATYLENSGIHVDADSTQVISGAQQGIDIIARTLLNHGDYVITENPTYTGATAAFRSRGARIIPVNISEDGIQIDELKAAVKKYHPRLIYIMPNFQNPTGFCYSQTKKEEILDICRHENIYIIEDDSFCELSYDGIERHPLKKMDTTQQVFYIKSFSKIFMPGLRVAFLLSPSAKIPDIIAAKQTADISTSGLMQRAFDLYLRKNLWKKHIEFMRKIYQERYGLILKAIEKYFTEEITFFRPGGGLTLWIKLDLKCSENAFYNQCLKEDIIISPGSLFYPNNQNTGHFRLSFAALYPEEIERGIRVLSHCYRSNIPGAVKKRKRVSPLL